MIRIPVRVPEPPRPHRRSSPDDLHFLSLCANRRRPSLATPHINSEVHAAMHLLALERQWQVRTAVVMPHHVHLFVHVDGHVALPLIVQTFKHRLSPCLEPAGLRWESGYFDRRLTADDDPLPVFLYIFQNPYQARLIPPGEAWPGYFCSGSDLSWFTPLRHSPCEFPAWLLHWRLNPVALAPT